MRKREAVQNAGGIILEKKAFDLIVSRTDKVLSAQGFQKQKGMAKDVENGDAVLFIGDGTAFSIIYDSEGNRFELKSTSMTDDGIDEEHWKSISSWSFNPETDTLAEAESIASDFCNTLDDSKRRAQIRAARRKSSSRDNDNNPGPVFFYKRLVSVFPELREEIAIEQESWEDFRAVTFAKEKIVPKAEAIAKKKNSKELTKFAGLLEEFSKSGDLDVRSIISMVILNGVSPEARNTILGEMSEEYRKYHKRCTRYIHKKVRPEKTKKKRRTYTSASSSGTGERLSGKVPKGYK